MKIEFIGDYRYRPIWKKSYRSYTDQRVNEGLSDLSTSFVKKFKSSPRLLRAQLRV